MDVTQFPQLDSLADMRQIITNGARVGRPSLFLSPPGVGKTATAIAVARELGLAPVFLELGLTVQEEIGGIPVRDPQTGAVLRFPLGPIRHACEHPSLLILDEVTRADASRQGAAMTGVNERRWGDWSLHPKTVVVLLGNEPDSGGTHTILDALLNRCGVYRVKANRAEIRDYLYELGAEGSNLRLWASDYAAISESRGELIAEVPPNGFSESGALWPSPRAIEHGISRLASLADAKLDPTSPLALKELSGVIGMTAASAYITFRRLRDKIATPKEIAENPLTATLPSDIESAVASVSVAREAMGIDVNAAWLYINRYTGDHRDAQNAAVRVLSRGSKQPNKAEALQVYTALLGRAGASMVAMGTRR